MFLPLAAKKPLLVTVLRIGVTDNIVKHIEWQWRNFFIPIYASCSGRRDGRQRNVNILQHLQPDRRSGAELFLKPAIQFYLNNVTNLHQLISHSTT